MPRLLIFANPTSGRGRGIALLQTLTPALQRAGWDLDVIVEHPKHVSTIDRIDQIESLIVIGGDGTLRVTIECLMRLAGDHPLPPALVMGLGTANLMQQHLRLRYDHSDISADVIRLLKARSTVNVDTSLADDHLFLLMASCGYDAAVVHELAAKRTGPITKLTYVGPCLTALRDYAFPEVTVEVDGTLLHKERPALVFVGNVPEYGTGFPVLTRASSFDQRLDVCILPCRSRHELLHIAFLVLAGRHQGAKDVIYTTGRDIRITCPKPVPLQLDGEAAGFAPTHIRLLDRRIAFIVR